MTEKNKRFKFIQVLIAIVIIFCEITIINRQEPVMAQAKTEYITTVQTKTKVITTIRKKANTKMKKLTPKLQAKISATTKAEPSGSDLTLIQSATRLATARLPQGYTTDGTYYYYLSMLANTGASKNDLRLTRVKYTGFGRYKESYMTLKQFGHGTTIDCVVENGVTYLWTGSDPVDSKGGTSTISCFTFQTGKTLKKHSSTYYRIKTSSGRWAYNCFPAISPDGKTLAVRYTSGAGQKFLYYKLEHGTYIDTNSIQKEVKCPATSGDFQGFDIAGDNLYTIEGSPSKKEMKALGKVGKYRPTKIRIYNTKTKASTEKTIKGAKKITHREAEGIQIIGGKMRIMMASHYEDLYTCANVYEVR